ncbi:MAG: hypothetical protein WBD40_09980 [Tepidisphaeraceae bacterium]
MIIFNSAAFVLGVGSLIVSLAVGYALGWVSFGEAKPSPHLDYAVLLGAAMLAVTDLAWRLRNIRTLNTPPPPTIITREGPVATRPQPIMSALNMFLSGERGAQFFWIIPGWVVGLTALSSVFVK